MPSLKLTNATDGEIRRWNDAVFEESWIQKKGSMYVET